MSEDSKVGEVEDLLKVRNKDIVEIDAKGPKKEERGYED